MPAAAVNILLVDPDEGLSSAVRSYLVSLDYQVSCAVNGELALQNMQAQTVDVLICEASLLAPSAFDLHAAATQLGIPTIFFSEEHSVRNVVQALREGVADFILKPLDDFAVLDRVLQRVVAAHNLESDLSKERAELQRVNQDLLEHIKTLEQDRRAGQFVQSQFLPDAEADFCGLKVSYDIYPQSQLCGDAIDFGLFGGRYFAFYLIDVSGHGAAAAFVTVWVRQIVRGFLKGAGLEYGEQPLSELIPKLLDIINMQLIKADVRHHLTGMVGVIDTMSGDMHYVIAGHLPLPLLRTADGVQSLTGTGKPVGLFETASWGVLHHRLPQSYSLLVSSDGILDLLAEKTLTEQEARLADILGDSRVDSAQAVICALDHSVDSKDHDDITLLLISKT